MFMTKLLYYLLKRNCNCDGFNNLVFLTFRNFITLHLLLFVIYNFMIFADN